MRKATWIVIVMGLALVLAACGQSDPSTSDENGATPTPAEEQAPTPTPTPTPPAAPTPERDSAPTPTLTPSTGEELDPDVAAALADAGLSTRFWDTNFNKHSVPFSEILSGGPPKDGIPSIDDPKFISISEADEWLADNEPVQALEIGGAARAYPLQILIWHEIVNDVVDGKPVAVTYCPLCNSAIVFDATVDGRVLDFGTTGNLRFSDLVMYDRQTESWWQQITGEAIIGDMLGTRLKPIASPVISWGDFKEAHPDGRVLSRRTGFNRDYGRNPYTGYDSFLPFLFDGELDDRIRATERVATVEVESETIAFPFSVLQQQPVVQVEVGGREIVVFHKPGTASALDARDIAEGKDVGATGVFIPEAGGRSLTFEADGDTFKDIETGSTWDILGRAVDGPLAGETLEAVVHGNHFWFSWAVFKPDTIVYEAG